MTDKAITYLQNLNKQQSEAVSFNDTSLAVMAGAGSGKTKVLTHRIAWLLDVKKWSPQSILAVTFTNKAANEMKNRLQLLGIPSVTDMWVGTFHGLAYRFLRKHHQAAQLPKSFQILDASDQEKVMKKLFKQEDIDPDEVSIKEIIYFINRQKDAGKRPNDVDMSEHMASEYTPIYKQYQDFCDSHGWVDFGELILRCYETTVLNPAIKQQYQTLFHHVLVDEFQDTNDIQYKWIAELSEYGQSIPTTIVGDMDQSIYSWRGAKMGNVEKFINEFADAHMIKLEQNYRSTHHILSSANALIQNNVARIDKNLWTQKTQGEAVSLFEAYDDKEEADWAVLWAIKQHKITGKWSDTAILYRSNAQSRILEEACIKRNIPYKIYGGLRFFERAEIKDALSHLYMIEDPNNDLMLERALTSPGKGFGPKNLEALREFSILNNLSWSEALSCDDFLKTCSAKVQTTAGIWLNLWNEQKSVSFEEKVRFSVEKTGLMEHYRKLDLKEGTDRVENLKELVSVAIRFAETHKASPDDMLSDFLSSVSLESETDKETTNAIQFMTIHAAKGLEFPSVCCVGWDDGLFPSSHANSDGEKLEEERRLAYVATTRAEERLCITTTLGRRQYGQYLKLPPSRFLEELPSDHCVWARMPQRKYKEKIVLKNTPTNPLEKIKNQNNSLGKESFWKVGDEVSHPQFGRGKILRVDGLSRNDRVLVSFGGEKKVLLPQLAKLQKI